MLEQVKAVFPGAVVRVNAYGKYVEQVLGTDLYAELTFAGPRGWRLASTLTTAWYRYYPSLEEVRDVWYSAALADLRAELKQTQQSLDILEALCSTK